MGSRSGISRRRDSPQERPSSMRPDESRDSLAHPSALPPGPAALATPPTGSADALILPSRSPASPPPPPPTPSQRRAHERQPDGGLRKGTMTKENAGPGQGYRGGGHPLRYG